MKSVILILITATFVFNVAAQQAGSIKDPRDGKTYKTIKIDNQTWMAENLAYKPDSGDYWAYDNDSRNVSVYGYLYDWETAMNVCPAGWHLPDNDEWIQLTAFLGGEEFAGIKMKSKKGWVEGGNGSNESGFSALPGGNRLIDGSFYGVGQAGYWSSATLYERILPGGLTYPKDKIWYWHRRLTWDCDFIYRTGYGNKGSGFSVRCLKDN